MNDDKQQEQPPQHNQNPKTDIPKLPPQTGDIIIKGNVPKLENPPPPPKKDK